MAKEEVIILEAPALDENFTPINDEIGFEEEDTKPRISDEEKVLQQEQKKRKILRISSFILGLLLAIVTVFLAILLLKKPDVPQHVISATHEDEKPTPTSPFLPSKVDEMVKKANLLYEQGNKQEALKLYESIATFNEAISDYNLGVAKMKEQRFVEALSFFKKAIHNKEHQCISAINAAICALHLKDDNLFKYYIDLAFVYLPDESQSPLYSYYVALVHYYKGLYYEALSAMSHNSTPFYTTEQKYLSSKILTSLGHIQPARQELQAIKSDDDSLTLGLLYAKEGDFVTSKEYLLHTFKQDPKNAKISMALSLIENKLGNLENSASLLKEATDNMPNKSPSYRIHASLKNALFDIQTAQREFDKELFFNTETIYNALFYYAPYKVFDAKQAMHYTQKGSMNLFIDEMNPALSYLKVSADISKVNIGISKGIQKALDFHIFEANAIFLKMVNEYKNHSILHYNLALTYAQMGKYPQAYQHFLTSYYLDNNNYLAGIFAIMNGHLIGKEVTKLTESIKEGLLKNQNLKEDNLYNALLYLSDNNALSLGRWLEKDKEATPLNLMLDIIAARKLNYEKKYHESAEKLQQLLPKDMLSNIIAFQTKHAKEDIKAYAKAIQIEFNNLSLQFDAFYFGPKIVREQYVKLLQIGGLLHQKRASIRKKMEEERNDIVPIMQTLAYFEIYANQFDEALKLYNKLIDELGQKDSQTLLLASIAAIGSGSERLGYALALLELSKLTDPNNKESLYALGLLYQEIGNFEAAQVQYRPIGNSGFNSKYFTFDIVQ